MAFGLLMGAVFIAFSAVQLVPAIFPDRMPRWLPVARLTASWNPGLFKLKNGAFAAVGATGVVIMIVESLRHFSILR